MKPEPQDSLDDILANAVRASRSSPGQGGAAERRSPHLDVSFEAVVSQARADAAAAADHADRVVARVEPTEVRPAPVERAAASLKPTVAPNASGIGVGGRYMPSSPGPVSGRPTTIEAVDALPGDKRVVAQPSPELSIASRPAPAPRHARIDRVVAVEPVLQHSEPADPVNVPHIAPYIAVEPVEQAIDSSRLQDDTPQPSPQKAAMLAARRAPGWVMAGTVVALVTLANGAFFGRSASPDRIRADPRVAARGNEVRAPVRLPEARARVVPGPSGQAAVDTARTVTSATMAAAASQSSAPVTATTAAAATATTTVPATAVTAVPATAVTAVPAAAPPTVQDVALQGKAVPRIPVLSVVAESTNTLSPAMAAKWLGRGRAGAGLELAAVSADGWAASLAALAAQPRITVVRYDALQAARKAPAAARIPSLEVVAPIALEPLFVVARADSPLQYVHELKGRKINTGGPRSSRALTADAMYRALFGEEVPPNVSRGLDEAAALQRLGEGSLDAVVLIGDDARAWFAQPSVAAGSGFKLLAFDASQGGARKAFTNFFPMQAAAGALGRFPAASTLTLSVMSFVVTARPKAADAEAHARAIAALGTDLCNGALDPTARSGGSQKRLSPALQVEVGWPYSEVAQASLTRCGASAAPVARTAAGVSAAPS